MEEKEKILFFVVDEFNPIFGLDFPFDNQKNIITMPTFQDFVCLFLIQTNKQKLLLSRLAGTLSFRISVFIIITIITIPDNILGIFFRPHFSGLSELLELESGQQQKQQ